MRNPAIISSRHLVICFQGNITKRFAPRPSGIISPRLTTPQIAVPPTSLAYLQHFRSPKTSISTAKISPSTKIAKLSASQTSYNPYRRRHGQTQVYTFSLPPAIPALVRQTNTTTTDGVILDAGSSGTRMHVYRWADAVTSQKHASKEELSQLPRVETKKKWTKKTSPGNPQRFPQRLSSTRTNSQSQESLPSTRSPRTSVPITLRRCSNTRSKRSRRSTSPKRRCSCSPPPECG